MLGLGTGSNRQGNKLFLDPLVGTESRWFAPGPPPADPEPLRKAEPTPGTSHSTGQLLDSCNRGEISPRLTSRPQGPTAWAVQAQLDFYPQLGCWGQMSQSTAPWQQVTVASVAWWHAARDCPHRDQQLASEAGGFISVNLEGRCLPLLPTTKSSCRWKCGVLTLLQ